MSDLFANLQATLSEQGADAAIAQLCESLKSQQDYDNLFYARLLATRYKLGLTPIPTAPATEVPEEKQEEFETAIRDACLEAGEALSFRGQAATGVDVLSHDRRSRANRESHRGISAR